MKSYIIGLISLILVIGSGISVSATSNLNKGITPEEIEGLVKMYEEEKMAHDIYTQLYDRWALPVFYNISQSEQRHLDALQGLLRDFEIENESPDQPGSYASQEMQSLYQSLMESGNKSITDALIVGATIEDLDISDLDKLLDRSENVDIIRVYENLNKGSRNHLRTFNELLQARDLAYTPVYLSNVRYLEIVNSAMERGGINRNGQSGKKCQAERSCRNGKQNKKCLNGKQGSCQNKNKPGMRGNRKGKGRGQVSI